MPGMVPGIFSSAAQNLDGLIKLAHALEMTVVAEGIEEEKQLRELVKLGCDFGQGYYFSRPVAAEAAEKLLTAP